MSTNMSGHTPTQVQYPDDIAMMLGDINENLWTNDPGPLPRTPPRDIPSDDSDVENEDYVPIGPPRNNFHASNAQYRQGSGSIAPLPPSITFDLPSREEVAERLDADDDNDDNEVANKSAPKASLPTGISEEQLRASSLMCAERPVQQTPLRKGPTTMDIPDGRSSPAPSSGEYLVEELGTLFVAPARHAQLLYESYPDAEELMEFEADGYDGAYDDSKNRWEIPFDPKLEKAIYTPMIEVLNTIIARFVTPQCPSNVTRKCVDAHALRFKHKGDNKYTSPDIVVQASGPSFEKPDGGSDLGYSNIATFFDIKRQGDMGGDITHIQQFSTYARQILAHQPNRFFVRCLLLSEEECRLFHFDRSGAEVCPAISIHLSGKDTFIRLVVNLCSPDEKILGFDTSVQWDTVKGFKKNGWLYSNGKKYSLVNQHPIAVQVIRGRATTCWHVEDPATKKRFIVKDSWTPQGRTEEHLLLQKAQGLTGVCQMVSFEARRCATKEFRSYYCARSKSFWNRIASRIVIKEYGKPIQHFQSPLQLVTAIRDALAGHLRLLGRARILHRDISNKNILLGQTNAEGHRGVLIDLNASVDLDNDRQGPAKEARTGSRFFQSLSVLDSQCGLNMNGSPAHDYVDDIESFFYVLCYIFLLFLANGKLRPAADPGRRVLRGWASEHVQTAADSKAALFDIRRLHGKIAVDAIRSSWGDACAVLFEKYLMWVKSIQEERGQYLRQVPAGSPTSPGIFRPILEKVVYHYLDVLEILGDAIEALGSASEDPWKAIRDAFPSIPNNKKRALSPSGEEVDGEDAGPSQPGGGESRRDSLRPLPSRRARISG